MIPSFGAALNPSEVTETMRASPFSAAAFSKAGKQSLMSRACARWLIANWISYPSFETPGGTAITPALQMKMSRFPSDFWRKSFAASETELSDDWSQGMKVMLLELDLHAVITASAASALRPVK